MDVIERILERAAALDRRIVFPESEDVRTLRAAAELHRLEIVRPLLLGDRGRIEAVARQGSVRLDGVAIAGPEEYREPVLAALHEAATESILSIPDEQIEAWADDPLYCASALVRAGLVDGTVAGAVHSTPATISAALRVIRRDHDQHLVSSCFLMGLAEPTPGGEPALVFADAGLVIRPGVEELATIAAQSADHFAMLTERDPRVAMLSFSTLGSAKHEEVDRVRDATERLRAMRPELEVCGELQLDAAIVPEIAKKKAPGCSIRGRANVLVFPSLDAGNIGYKLVERLARARAIGPILQGLAKPANDLSRGCEADEIVVVSAVTALQGKGG